VKRGLLRGQSQQTSSDRKSKPETFSNSLDEESNCSKKIRETGTTNWKAVENFRHPQVFEQTTLNWSENPDSAGGSEILVKNRKEGGDGVKFVLRPRSRPSNRDQKLGGNQDCRLGDSKKKKKGETLGEETHVKLSSTKRSGGGGGVLIHSVKKTKELDVGEYVLNKQETMSIYYLHQESFIRRGSG